MCSRALLAVGYVRLPATVRLLAPMSRTVLFCTTRLVGSVVVPAGALIVPPLSSTTFVGPLPSSTGNTLPLPCTDSDDRLLSEVPLADVVNPLTTCVAAPATVVVPVTFNLPAATTVDVSVTVLFPAYSTLANCELLKP